MTVFDGLATGYDLGMLPLELAVLRGLRRQAFSSLKGRVLELGIGTGANLPFYGGEARVVALDASRSMLEEARDRPRRVVVRWTQGDVHYLPFPDGAFDVVAGSLLFCSVAEPARGLAAARRVLAADGRLVLLEHMRGRGVGAWLTDFLHPCWFAINETCHLNRQTTQTIVEAGFQLLSVEDRFLGIFRLITARKDGYDG